MSSNEWKPVDFVIMLLAALIVVFLILHSIARWGAPINVEVSKLIRDILLTILAIISVYVGSKIKDNHGKP